MKAILAAAAIAGMVLCGGCLCGGCRSTPAEHPIDYPLYDPVHSNYPFASGMEVTL